jgi:hypothetical protein
MNSVIARAALATGLAHEVEGHFALSLLHKGVIHELFRPRTSIKQDRRYDPLSLPQRPAQCVHVDAVYNEVEGTIDHVRCTANHKGEGGWLCEEHDYKLLQPRKPSFIPPRDYKAEAVDNVLQTERRALNAYGNVGTPLPREVHGTKYKIQFELDHTKRPSVIPRRMKTDPDEVKFDEPASLLNIAIAAEPVEG